MKLEKYNPKNPKKIGIIIFTITCILLITGVFLYTSFASFQTNDEFNIINGNVQEQGDLYFAFYVDGNISKTMPKKGEGYFLDKEKTACTNGASVEFDTNEWSIKVVNMTTSKTKCTLYFKRGYSEAILNGTDPIIKDPLIPVTIDSDGTVKKADISSEWYSYEKKNWANAIILKDESTASNYIAGSVIPEDEIESYFVWIPRYKYKIFDDGNYSDLTTIENAVQTIEVEFENTSTPVSSGTTTGSWLTHPAFTAFNTNGMWVGKFETGTALTSDYNVRNGESIQIKPNVTSWRSIQVANAFYTSYDYKRNLESHMMKNTERG